jgi:hypothetical protein
MRVLTFGSGILILASLLAGCSLVSSPVQVSGKLIFRGQNPNGTDELLITAPPNSLYHCVTKRVSKVKEGALKGLLITARGVLEERYVGSSTIHEGRTFDIRQCKVLKIETIE